MKRRSAQNGLRRRKFTRQGKLFASFVLILIIAIGATACSGPNGDDNGETADSTPTTSSTAPTATTAAQPSPTTAASPTTPAATPTGTAGSATPTSVSATPSTGNQLTLSVYFLRDEKIGTAHRQVPRTQQVGAAAIEELLAGPTSEESAAGLSSTIPQGTQLLGLTISNRVATANFSAEFESGGGSLSMAARLAQVVYTLTQFPTIDSVAFQLDGQPVEVFGGEGIILGEPVDRADFEDLTPLIFVESPAVGDPVTSPMRVWGTANTFEATFMLTVLDPNGNEVVEQVVTATSGTGTRGTFDVSVEFDVEEPGMGTLVVFEISAKDGSRVNIVEIPIEITT